MFRLSNVFALALTALLALAVTSTAQATKIERVVSPGGIEIWLVRDATVPVVSLNFAFKGGSAQDPAEKPGVSELAISTLDEGAGELDAAAFQERLERLAIELDFNSSRDHIRGTVRTLRENTDEAFELLRLALSQPRFDAPAIERMRAQMISRLRRESTSPNSIARKAWAAAAFPNHPYGRPSNGTIESVEKINVDDIRGYVRRVMARDTLKVALVGDIDTDTAGKLVDRAFGALPAKSELQTVPAILMQGRGNLSVVELEVPQAVIMFGAPGLARNDPDFMAAYIVNHILGGGSFSSWLYEEVRERRGLAYGIYTSLSWYDASALIIGNTATRSDAVATTLKVTEDVIGRMAADGPSQDEFDKAKAYLKGSFALGLDTSSKIANQLVQMQLDDLGIDYIDRRASLIDKVTLADAQRVAKRLLAGGLLTTIVGRPKGITTRNTGG